MTTTKTDLIDAMYRALNVSRAGASLIVEDTFELIRGELAKGNTVKIPGFGNFVVRKKNSRIGRNPKTNKTVEISARKVVSFKTSAMLRNRIR